MSGKITAILMTMALTIGALVIYDKVIKKRIGVGA